MRNASECYVICVSKQPKFLPCVGMQGCPSPSFTRPAALQPPFLVQIRVSPLSASPASSPLSFMPLEGCKRADWGQFH